MSMVNVHSIIAGMKHIAAGEFKQRCLRLLDEVRDTGEAVVITKRGVPVAQLAPLPRTAAADWEGALQGTGTITGDLVAPATDLDEWEAER
jgi:prevent-host-death family protein